MFSITRGLSRLKVSVPNVCRLLGTNAQQVNVPSPAVCSSIINNAIENPWIYRQPDHIKNPINGIKPIKLPNDLFWVPLSKEDKISNVTIEAPSLNIQEKLAARLIVIRRKKMKKHKLKKLRKRMKYEYAKIRQRRELKKEKAFQAVLIQQCKEAELFNAKKYVDEKLEKLHEIVIPRYWKGKRMPEFLVRQKMGLPPKEN
ncbi:PREDICTED: uncharacterized protein LOC108566407 [Nicrophorus vespilloides]|uniref:Uncharacterized protein LOC108566407 n=1 Tax=Nicrophorus vespilloides TaxID=110193 RepID=A0ABM1N4K6_NICVS|nr:PREDICTED: uncharacterized protein LOC108566407 [Nicrophorus vespilloides]